MEIEASNYSFSYLSYYFYYLYDIFVGFPLIIQICVFVILASIGIGLFLLLQTAVLYYNKRRETKISEDFQERFRDPLIEIGNDDVIHEPEDIAEMMKYDKRKPFNNLQKRLLVQLIVDTKTEITDTKIDSGETINRANFHNIVVAFDLPRFFERELQFARVKYRVRALTWIRFLEESVSGAVITPLLFHRNALLRKAAQATFMWNSAVDPFRFFDTENYDSQFRKWDEIDTHAIFVSRKKVGLNIPDVSHWIKEQKNEKLKPMFASEIRYMDKRNECDDLIETLVQTNDMDLRIEIINTLGAMKHIQDEDAIIDTYKTQPKRVKEAIIKAVVAMGTGRSLKFLVQCYKEANDSSVKFGAAEGLYKYGERGRVEFERLAAQSMGKESRIFVHIKDPIINMEVQS